MTLLDVFHHHRSAPQKLNTVLFVTVSYCFKRENVFIFLLTLFKKKNMADDT